MVMIWLWMKVRRSWERNTRRIVPSGQKMNGVKLRIGMKPWSLRHIGVNGTVVGWCLRERRKLAHMQPGRCTGSRLWLPGFYRSKKLGEMSKIILFNEYDQSSWWSLITDQDNFQLNKNKIVPHSSFLFRSGVQHIRIPTEVFFSVFV